MEARAHHLCTERSQTLSVTEVREATCKFYVLVTTVNQTRQQRMVEWLLLLILWQDLGHLVRCKSLPNIQYSDQ